MKRPVFLACAAMAATLMAAGVGSAQTEDGPEGARTIGEVPLEGDETRVGFVPGEAVEETSPNYRYRPQFVPNDYYFDPKPELPRAQYWLRAIKAPGAWDVSRGG